jgi:carotenoid cleavage dioxygenase-like enzyme
MNIFNRRRFLKSTFIASVSIGFHQLATAQENWSLSNEDWSSNDPFLSANNAPVFKESTCHQLKVTGSIPHGLEGVFLRNGPNPKFKPETYNYPFSGDGMIHGIYFENGKAFYRNRWVQTERLKNDTAAGKAIPSRSETSNTNIIYHHNKLLSLNDLGKAYEIDYDLNTLGERILENIRSTGAHPRIDPTNGEMHFTSYARTAPYAIYYVVDKNGRMIRNSPVELANPTIIHDMVITKNYAIIVECPVVFHMSRAQQGANPFTWNPENGTSLHIFDRNNMDRKPIVIKTEPFFVWHFMNAFDQNEWIYIDLVRHNDLPFTRPDRTYQYMPTSFHRISINVSSREVKHQQRDDRRIEFPSINQQKNGLEYKHGYAVILTKNDWHTKPPEYFAQAIQYDVKTNSEKIHAYGPGRFTGELAFIPNTATATSDGFLISFVFNETTQLTDVVLLDAANFDKEPIATIHLPVRVPNGLHGNWIAK